MAGAPKDKASSDLYVQLLSQAGTGTKPGWAADIKLSPALAHLGHGVFFSPLVLADVGLNTVQGNKVTNMIQVGLGVTKFVPTQWTELPGFQLHRGQILKQTGWATIRTFCSTATHSGSGKGGCIRLRTRMPGPTPKRL